MIPTRGDIDRQRRKNRLNDSEETSEGSDRRSESRGNYAEKRAALRKSAPSEKQTTRYVS